MTDAPIRRPTLDELETFLLAARCGSLTEAAAALHVSKTAVAKRIRSLEALVGHRLLDRGPRGASLTEYGRRLVPDVEALLRESERVFDRLTGLRADTDSRRIAGFRALSGSSTVSTEHVLRETEHFFAEIFHSIDDGIVVLSIDDYRILEANDAYARVVGHPREEILGRTAPEVAVVSPQEEANVIAALSRGPIVRQITQLQTPAGAKHVEFSLRPVTLGGKPCLLGIGRDISERVLRERTAVKQAAQQEAVTQLTLSALAGEPQAAIFARAAELVASCLDASIAAIWEANGGLELRSLHGIPRATLAGLTGTPESRRLFLEAIEEPGELWSDDMTRDRRFSRRLIRALGMRSMAAVKIGTKDGERYGFLVAASTEVAAFAPSDRAFARSVANVLGLTARSARRAAEEERQRILLENFTALVDASRDPMVLLSLDGHYVYQNEGARRFRAGDPAVDRASDSIYDSLDARAVHRLREVVFPETRRNGRWDGKFIVTRPSGYRRPGRLSTVLVRDPVDGSARWVAAIFYPEDAKQPQRT